MRLYFAYGSNMNREHMAKLCKSAEPLGVATAENNIYYIAACGYASLAPRRNSRVYGILWRVSMQDLMKLDAYESVDKGMYRSAAIPVHQNGKLLRALVYYAVEAKPGRPKPDYQEYVIAAAKTWDFPEAYLQELQKFLPRVTGEG
jgi:gamma-glutamylcyclotransferase (GGCT)/AIG2-like uncharacterized protein YtfP